ncbi:MAG: TraR/DksA family transcriptional regulator [Candidatus Rokuibacteriota bacterium]
MKRRPALDRRTVREIERFLNDSLVRLRESVRSVVSERRAGDTDGMADMTAQAAEALHDEIQVALVDRRSRQVAQINAALERLARGEYGICHDCDEFIGLPRLRAVPFAQRCSPCQTRAERHARRTAGPAPAGVFVEAA